MNQAWLCSLTAPDKLLTNRLELVLAPIKDRSSMVKTDSCGSCDNFQESSFKHLEKNELSCINSKKTCNTYKKGQVLFHEGNHPIGIFCLKSGKVKITKTSIDGKEQIVRFAKPGDLIGYRSFLGDGIYSATAIALEEAKVCFIDKADFLNVVKSNSAFSWSLIQKLSSELKDAENLVADMAQKSVRERLAEILLLLQKKFGTSKEMPGFLDVQLSREELANTVGTATETIIRLISDMKQEGLIKTQGKKIAIADLKSMMALANLED